MRASPLSNHAVRFHVVPLWDTLNQQRQINLDGEQFRDNFTAINPLQRVPALVDNGLQIVESLAILDYLEANYPTPSLMLTEDKAIAMIRMIETIPLTLPLLFLTYARRSPLTVTLRNGTRGACGNIPFLIPYSR